jgi:hypothetical protein
MRDYEELLTKVLRIVGEERRSEIEEEVERRISEDPRLTRLGALYMVAGELGLFGESSRGPPVVPLGKLVGGLGDGPIRPQRAPSYESTSRRLLWEGFRDRLGEGLRDACQAKGEGWLYAAGNERVYAREARRLC